MSQSSHQLLRNGSYFHLPPHSSLFPGYYPPIASTAPTYTFCFWSFFLIHHLPLPTPPTTLYMACPCPMLRKLPKPRVLRTPVATVEYFSALLNSNALSGSADNDSKDRSSDIDGSERASLQDFASFTTTYLLNVRGRRSKRSRSDFLARYACHKEYSVGTV